MVRPGVRRSGSRPGAAGPGWTSGGGATGRGWRRRLAGRPTTGRGVAAPRTSAARGERGQDVLGPAHGLGRVGVRGGDLLVEVEVDEQLGDALRRHGLEV